MLGKRSSVESSASFNDCHLGASNLIFADAPIFSPASRLFVAHPLAYCDLGSRSCDAGLSFLIIKTKKWLASGHFVVGCNWDFGNTADYRREDLDFSRTRLDHAGGNGLPARAPIVGFAPRHILRFDRPHRSRDKCGDSECA
jgi:hypothetical protein